MCWETGLQIQTITKEALHVWPASSGEILQQVLDKLQLRKAVQHRDAFCVNSSEVVTLT